MLARCQPPCSDSSWRLLSIILARCSANGIRCQGLGWVSNSVPAIMIKSFRAIDSVRVQESGQNRQRYYNIRNAVRTLFNCGAAKMFSSDAMLREVAPGVALSSAAILKAALRCILLIRFNRFLRRNVMTGSGRNPSQILKPCHSI